MTETSGIQNPNVVDLVSENPTTGEFNLIMVETRQWDGSRDRMKEIQAKVNTYVAFALDGEMARKFPESIDKPVCIQLNCFSEPDRKTKTFLERVERALNQHGVSFRVKILEA